MKTRTGQYSGQYARFLSCPIGTCRAADLLELSNEHITQISAEIWCTVKIILHMIISVVCIVPSRCKSGVVIIVDDSFIFQSVRHPSDYL